MNGRGIGRHQSVQFAKALDEIAAREPHGELAGFGLRVRASGRKYYVVQFRANGRLRRMTLGRHGAVTPETARRRAMALISEAKGGKDPAALRDKGRKAATMKVLGRRFLEEYVPVHCESDPISLDTELA